MMIFAVGVIQTTRFYKSAVVALVFYLLTSSPIYAVNVLIFLLFSFVFNDFIDAPKDKLGHPERAIPSGKISRAQSFWISLFLLCLGITAATFSQYLIGLIAAYGLSILYSSFFKPYVPLIGTFVWSTAVSIVFVQPFTLNFWSYVGFALVVYGYELLLDQRDVIADKIFCKTPTLPALIGKGTFLIAPVTIIIGIVILFASIYR